MNKTAILILIAVVGVGLIFSGLWLVNSSESEEEQVTTAQQEQDGVTEPDVVSYTVEEVSLHSTGTDCWTIVGGSVYNITSYVPVHPGGDEILRACGTDGTTLFNSRTTEDGEQIGSGTPHSSNAFSQLGPFFIGDLAV